jgi:hypothetical protein
MSSENKSELIIAALKMRMNKCIVEYYDIEESVGCHKALNFIKSLERMNEEQLEEYILKEL